MEKRGCVEEKDSSGSVYGLSILFFRTFLGVIMISVKLGKKRFLGG